MLPAEQVSRQTLADLDFVLKSSLAHASSHSKKVYGQNPLTAREIIDLANSRALVLAATVKPNGRPHLSPSDVVAVDDVLYIGLDTATARYKNLKQNPAVTIMLADGWKRQAILEGQAKFLDVTSQTAKKVFDAEKNKYGWTTEAIAEFIPEKIFTYKSK